LKTEERQHKRIKELMGIKPKLITEQGYDDSVADYLATGLEAGDTMARSLFGGNSGSNNWKLDPNDGVTSGGIDVNAAATSAVDARLGTKKARELIGNTPISQGYVNHVVWKYFDDTGPFGFTYSFLEDVIVGETKILADTSHTTKDAEYIASTNTILIDSVEVGETKNDETLTGDTETTNRNQKIVDLFSKVGIKLDSKNPLVIYFRKNIRPVLRRLKKEFPEYKINFTDQATKWEGDGVVVDHFMTTKDILFEGYKETLTQLMKLKAAKKAQKKDSKMIGVLDTQIKKETQNLLKIIKPKIQNIFKEAGKSIKDIEMIRFAVYLNAFLGQIKKDYPQYNISYGNLILKEEETKKQVGITITLAKGQDEVYIGRTYPCTVKVEGKDAGSNDVTILDVDSKFVNKGNNKVSGPTKTDKDGKVVKTEEDSYIFPKAGSNYGDKGKRFWVTMTIDVEPVNYLISNTQTNRLKAYKEYVYVVEMLFNGFKIQRINSSDFLEQNFDSENIKFLFDDDVNEVIFKKPYQIEVLSGDKSLGKLNITVDKIERK